MAAEPNGLEDDDDYNSASDHDFNPDAPNPELNDAESSSSEDDGPQSKNPKKRKEVAEDLDFDNSGDEATIAKAKRKKRKVGREEHDPDNDDDGGEGGLVKTRAQRRAEVQEKKPLVQAGKASVNVDDLWAQMSGPRKPSNGDASIRVAATAPGHVSTDTKDDKPQETDPSAPKDEPLRRTGANNEDMVTIKRSYEFAGQKMEEERIVPASSAEARLYLEEQSAKAGAASITSKSSLRRPKKRASMFDSPGADSASTAAGKGSKLNTLEKSKLDWAAHVDQEGISEELDEHRRAKGGYLGRMDFLGRMDAKREEDLKNSKPK